MTCHTQTFYPTLSHSWYPLSHTKSNSDYSVITSAIEINRNVRPTLPPLTHQSWIGWGQIYQGQVCKAWAQAIDRIHKELPMMGAQVMTILVKIIWTYILDTWKLPNNHLHNHAAQLNLPNYRQAVTNLYKQSHLIPTKSKEALFWQPLETILEQLAPQLQGWAKQGLSYFNQQLKTAKTQATLWTPNIRQFFSQQTQQPNDLQ